MNDGKQTLRRLGLYGLLLALNVLPCASVIPDSFPTRNLSTIYLLALSVCLVLYYGHRVSPAGKLSARMRALSWMGLLLILLRGVKYSAVAEVGVLARHAWYLYYLPLLLLPLFLFEIALLVTPKDAARAARLRHGALALTLLFIGLVLTNDLHQLVFRFQPGFRDWDDAYSRGWLFYAVTVWQYALYLAAIVLLLVKCRVSGARRDAWLILIPFGLGFLMNHLLLTDTMPRLNGSNVVEFPEALIFTAAGVLECCMQLGLIPTNTDYGRLFRRLSISAQITDREGVPVYASASAAPLGPEALSLPDGARIGPHVALRRMELPGGFGFWQDDLTELDRLNAELAEAKDELAQEAELTRLRNELMEKQTAVEQRTLVYDTIARRTQRQSQAISRLAKAARLSGELAVKEDCRRRIALLGAYCKRYANLTLLSQERREIEAGELELSVLELLRYLNLCGIPGELVGGAEGLIPAEAALAAFEAFGTLLETNITSLEGAFVNLSSVGSVLCKLTLEGLTKPLPEETVGDLEAAGVRCAVTHEDGVGYVRLTIPRRKGAEGA